VIRRSLTAALAATLLLSIAAGVQAQDPTCAAGVTPPCVFEHDSSRDGTPNEIVSGFFGGDDFDDSNGDTLADRVDNSFEAFDFTIPEGTQAGNFTVNVTWGDARVDLDLYVYRRRPDGTIVPGAIASSASFGDNTEDATYTPKILGQNVEPDTYVAVVDNWCSNDADDDPTSSDPADTADCGIGANPPADEDDFVGSVKLGAAQITNLLPSVSLSGPDAGRVGAALTYTAQGTDPDGRIANYRFDLDGDGYFERNALGANVVQTEFGAPGVYNVGVQVTDDKGDTAYASKAVRITGPPRVLPVALGALESFKLSNPVFGGRKGKSLVIRYRLRARSRVTLSLYRGKTRVKRLASGVKKANRTYRIKVKPKGLRKATYTARISVRPTAGGKRQRARLSSKRL
jgi:hypothetical protein